MSVDALVPRVRTALGVSSQYDSEEIPNLIRGRIGRLLRDYNFPKSVQRAFLGTGANATDGNPTLVLDEDSFDLPAGFKRDLQLRFRDPDLDAWSQPLQKREGFILPDGSGVTSWYWLEGTKLCLDEVIDTDGVGKQLVLIYQSLLVDTASEAWVTTDFEDSVVLSAIVRGALDFRKPDVATSYAALWTDERESLAIYLNELEWANTVNIQREMRSVGRAERYPTSARDC